MKRTIEVCALLSVAWILACAICLLWTKRLIEDNQCQVDRLSRNDVEMYYWVYVHHPGTICALAYAHDPGPMWEVQIPHPGQPTPSYTLNSREEAFTFIENTACRVKK